jgi:hypothetical protein
MYTYIITFFDELVFFLVAIIYLRHSSRNANPDYVFMLCLVNARKLINNDDIPIIPKKKNAWSTVSNIYFLYLIIYLFS